MPAIYSGDSKIRGVSIEYEVIRFRRRRMARHLQLHHAVERVGKEAATFHPVAEDDSFVCGSFGDDHLSQHSYKVSTQMHILEGSI